MYCWTGLLQVEIEVKKWWKLIVTGYTDFDELGDVELVSQF
jgi:hypothetical protein